ncbi:hypothetical protein C8R45DRAFT_1209748 [Mycena sanguinolenta]|nr:hypothetical protein C8R45DRAFT_1209748 [Mycena sanguinolenta]
MLPFAVGPLSNRPPQYQNQYSLVNRDGVLGLAAVSRRVLALPLETLAEIFLFCLQNTNGRVIPNPKEAPLVLCAVCRQWRNIALNTPELWCSLFLGSRGSRFFFPTGKTGALYVDLCRNWLSRARSVPLSLWVLSLVPEDILHSITDLVRSLSHQWREISLGAGVSLSIFPEEGTYPCLERVSLGSFPPPPDAPILSFRNALRLCSVYFPRWTSRIELPWKQITKFDSGDIDIEDCLEVLHHLSNLVDAQLRIPIFDSFTPPADTILLPQLQSLTLGTPYHHEEDHGPAAQTMPVALLACLKTPALKTLAFGTTLCNSSVCDKAPFLSFVSQSPFQLHTLKLSRMPTTVDALLDCLKATPTLVDLRLQISLHIPNLDPLFVKMTGQSDFLPRLETLYIALWGKPPIVHMSLVLTALLWRCMSAAGIRLKRFRFAVLAKYCDQEKYFKSIKSHPVFPVMEALAEDLYLGERTSEDATSDLDTGWASPVRTLRNGKAYGEFFDEAIVDTQLKELSQAAVSEPQRPISPTVTLSMGAFTNHPPQYQKQYILANDDGWLRLVVVDQRVFVLPPELLAEIFLFCIACDDFSAFPEPYDASLVLWAICAVCRQWMVIALTTPRLWSTMCFDLSELDSMDSDLREFYMYICRGWLDRAQNTRLSIRLKAHRPVPVDHLLVELVCQLSQQWYEIEFGEGIPISLLPANKYPLLEKLSISAPVPHHPIPNFHDAPRLRGVFMSEYTTKIQLPWHQLTRFRTDDIDIQDCLELLRQAPNLVDVHLGLPTYDSLSLLPDTILSLPQLESLNLSATFGEQFFADVGVMRLLECLETAAMKTLTLGSVHARRRNNTHLHDMSPLMSFVSRSSLQLHTLKLLLVPNTADALIACLMAMPSVIHLELRVSHRIFDTKKNAQFTAHHDFLPKLQRLRIAFSNTSILDASLVLDVLIWRCMTAGVTPLQSCRFEVYSRNYNTTLPLYLRLIKAHPVYLGLQASGMELHLRGSEWTDLDSWTT